MKKRKVVYCGVSVMVLLAAAASAQNDDLLTLKPGSWVCDSSQSYDEAVAEQQRSQNLEQLQQRLFKQQRCIYMDAERLKTIQVPLVKVIGQEHQQSKVSFVIKSMKRVSLADGSVSYVRYIGWTATDNVKSYFE